MIDPIVSLAHSMVSSKGAYALLLGSGVSRAASIPTGWEIVLDLIKKYARMKGADPGDDPAGWYLNEFGSEPDYSQILEGLAPSREDRQQLLRGYFERTPDSDPLDRTPTKAHRAIADLARRGVVRVILTTNFDQLLEHALNDDGVVPVVISTADSAEGALPLTHQKTCVIKLHGDYLDPRIKNSPSELASYDARMQSLLDRVLDEFGLVICGWSGQWDTALVEAFQRCKNRRFSTYWARRGLLRPEAATLLNLRGGIEVSAPDADHFFCKLQEAIASLEDLNADHHLNASIAAATSKRYLSDFKYRINLSDLIDTEALRAVDKSDAVYDRFGKDWQGSGGFSAFADCLNASLEVFQSIGVQISRWGDFAAMRKIGEVVGDLGSDKDQYNHPRNSFEDCLKVLPAAISFYLFGVTAVAADNLDTLSALMNITRRRTIHRPAGEQFIAYMPWHDLRERGRQFLNSSSAFSFQKWLLNLIRPHFMPMFRDERRYTDAFVTFEMILSLAYFGRKNPLPVGERPARIPGLFSQLDSWNENFPPRKLVDTRFDYLSDLARRGTFGVPEERLGELCEAFVAKSLEDAERYFM